MSIRKASRKVNTCPTTERRYYNLYKNDPEKKISLPRNRYMRITRVYTQEQIGNLIRYINDKMTVREASAKANMPYSSAHKYYTRYLKDPNHTIPLTRVRQYYTQE
jgi:hypothetical protein